MKTRWCFLMLLLATARLSAGPEIEFSGVLAAGSETKVSLMDKATGASRWVKLGQEFGGYVVSSYDAKAETVLLTKGAQQFRLQLKSSSKVKAGPAVEPTEEAKKAILNHLRMFAAASDQYYLENGVNHTTYDELVGPTKYIKSMEAVAGEDYRQLVFQQGKPLTVTTAGGFTMSYPP
jgi:hypothetical protein